MDKVLSHVWMTRPLFLQVFLDMVENYPTSLRVLVLAENDISPELQQQICDLLSEGEEDDDREAPPLQPGHASSSALLPIRDKYQPIRDKYQPPAWLPHSSKGWTLPLSSPSVPPDYPTLYWSLRDTSLLQHQYRTRFTLPVVILVLLVLFILVAPLYRSQGWFYWPSLLYWFDGSSWSYWFHWSH